MQTFLNEHWGDIASVLGLLVSVVGFWFALVSLRESREASLNAKDAAIRAEEAARATRDSIFKSDTGKGQGSILDRRCLEGSITIMPRQLRIQYPGTLYHVTARGDRREDIVNDDGDREMLLATLVEACKKTGWECHSCLSLYRTLSQRKWRWCVSPTGGYSLVPGECGHDAWLAA